MLTIKKMLELYGLDMSEEIKIARHQDTRDVDVHELLVTNQFELYQSYQERNQFKDCNYIVSCLGIENNQALFIGVYKVNDTYNVNGFPSHHEVSFRGKAKVDSKYKYDLEKVAGFEDLEGRLVIRWNNVAQAWCVKIDTSEKEVVQLLPRGYVRDFPGYLDVNLFYRDMKAIIDDPDANGVWHKMLSSVAAVYLIVDTTDGKQYVGSASGKEGLFGRWKQYTRNGHGGNTKLVELLENDPDRVYKFRYTILQTLPITFTRTETLKEESKYMNKLGSRSYGLNS